MCSPKCQGGLGFCNLKTFNISLLAKQGWRILQNEGTLLHQVFKARYFSKSSFFDAPHSLNPSGLNPSLSIIYLTAKKYPWDLEIILRRKTLRQLAITFDISLYNTLHKLMRQISLTFKGYFFFRIKVARVWLRSLRNSLVFRPCNIASVIDSPMMF